MDLVRWLQELDCVDAALAGGKGANLGALTRAGFPVPVGFVVLVPAYRTFVESNGLQSEIDRLMRVVHPDEPASTETASSAIRALFDSATMPDVIAQAILAAYRQMGEGPVAVRSSAIAEDLPIASSAGQQESFLNVNGSQQLIVAVRRCLSSLWTARAIAYRLWHGIGLDRASMAVLVQQMVPSETAGVLFTANPVSGDRDEIVVNAAWGLGEAIVAGRVNPDSFVVDKTTRQVKRAEMSDKVVATVPTVDGTTEVAVESQRRKKQSLTVDQIDELARLGTEIETHFGTPQDIEWSVAVGKVYILQARPITGLQPVSRFQERNAAPGDDSWGREDDISPQPFDLWTRTNFGENLPYPVSPLTATGFPILFGQVPQSQQGSQPGGMVRRFYGRLYVNEGLIMHTLEGYGLPSGMVDAIWGSRRRGKHRSRGKFRPLRLLRSLPVLLRTLASQTKNKGPKQTPEEFFAQIDRWVNDSSRRDLSELDDRALWSEGLPIWGRRGGSVFGKNLSIATSAAFLFAALERLVGWWSARKDITHDLVTGLSGIYSAEVGPALREMARTIERLDLTNVVLELNSTEALAQLRARVEAHPVCDQLEAFLHRHGHRCPNEVELLNPRWAEAPEQVIAMVAGYLQAGDRVNSTAAEARRRREEATAAVEAKLGPVRRALFRFVLGKAQNAVRLRDNSRYYVAKFYFPMRRLYWQLGQRWADRGWLDRPDDIFFLTVSEIEDIVEMGGPFALPREPRSLVTDRRLAYEYWHHVVPPEVIGPDGVAVMDPLEDKAFLEGVAASGGRVRGIARLVHDPRQAVLLRPGEILVTQATDPGWTPVFPLVSGLVLEIGGQLSHGAIVAREYGVPAVVNVQGAMQFIKDGQFITVDGSAGRVYLG